MVATASKLTKFFAVFCAIAFGGAAVWVAMGATEPFPIVGMRRVAANGGMAWPLFLVSLWVLVLCFVQKVRTHDRIVFTSGMLAAIGFTLGLFVGGGWVVIVLLAGQLYRDTMPSNNALERPVDHRGAQSGEPASGPAAQQDR